MTANITLSAYYLIDHPDVPSRAVLAADFDTETDRDAFLARFPKSVGVKAVTSYGVDREPRPAAKFDVRFLSDRANGGVNETGIARFRKVLTLTPDAVWTARTINSYRTPDAALDALGGDR